MAAYRVLELYVRPLRRKSKGLYPTEEIVAYSLPDEDAGEAPLVILRKWNDGAVEIIMPREASPETWQAYTRLEAAFGTEAFMNVIRDERK
jgi:hypothetical protein